MNELSKISETKDSGALAADKRRLLAQLLKEKGINTTRAPQIPKREEQGPAVLSFAQQRLWFLDQLEPGNVAYNLSKTIPLPGETDVRALEEAINEIVRRHESLRTRFRVIDGQPRQEVIPEAEVKLCVIDLSDKSEDERMEEVKQQILVVTKKPFNLSEAPLFRSTLIKLSDEESVLILTMHHIISDGWSVNVLIKELTALYQSFLNGLSSPLEELPIQYADFAVWQRERLQGDYLEQQLEYWKGQLKGAPALLPLPTDKPRPAVFSHQGARFNFALSAELSERLGQLSRNMGATLFMTLLGAFQLLLSRYSGESDVVVGTPIAGRLRRETEALIGFFINTLVMRVRIDEEKSFRELMEEVKEAALGAYAHQEVPFEKLVEELEPERSMSYTPLFQVMFALQNNGPKVSLEVSDESLESAGQEKTEAKFDLNLSMMETEQRLIGAFAYNTDLFDAATINRLVGHYKRLLEAICDEPERRLFELPLLSGAELHQLLVEWNNTERRHPEQGRCIQELFEQQAARTPNAIALVYEYQELSYSELNRRANRLAQKLVKLGVGPDVRVGILCDRSVEMVVGILAVLKAGGAYVPLDPNYPAERLLFMLKDAELKVLLVKEEAEGGIGAPGLEVVAIEDGSQENLARYEENVRGGAGGENIAYIIYTSGSTGQPKGVMIPHRAIANHMAWMLDRFPLSETDSLLQKTPFSFDASVWEFYAPLLSGARLVMARPAGHLEPRYLIDTIKEQGVTTLQVVPPLLQLLLQEESFAGCTTLKRVFCGGEALSKELHAKFFDTLDAELINLYGPTEATIDATYWACKRDDNQREVPIGRGIANTQLYILDDYLQPAPVGVYGHLHIGGAGLARGYFNRPALTAERFIPHPFSTEPGARLYRTGDLARYLPDGSLEYLGRSDHQVKLRGYRIELGEIEAVILEHPLVRQCVVIVREDVAGDRRLVAYLVAEGAAEIEGQSVRRYLQQQLPEYMIPQSFVTLEELPLTPSGKLDRRALPAPEQGRLSEASYVAPRNSVEEVITNIWKEVLRAERVGVEDNFFELGGHSLLATQVITRVRETFQAEELPLRRLFEEPTVAGLSMAVAEEVGSAEIAEEIAKTIKELEQYSAEEVAALLAQQDAEGIN